MAIPGIELTERPWAGSADSRLFARDPGPGNPNVGRESLRAPVAAPAAPSAPPVSATPERPSLRNRAFTSGGRMLGKATRAFGPTAAAVGAISQLGTHQIDDPDVDSSAAGTWNALRKEGPAGLFTEGSDTRMSLGKGLHEAVADVGGIVAGAADMVLPGTPMTDRLNQGLRSAYGGQMAIPGSAPAVPDLPTTASGTPGAPPAAPQTSAPAPAAPTPVAPAATPAAQTDDVTRVGNSYFGGNVGGNITVNGETPGGGTITAQNMAAADNLAQRETLRGVGAALQGMGTTQRPVLQAPGNSDNSWQARNNLRNLEVSASSIYNNQSAWGNKAKGAADVMAYQNARATDTALRAGTDPGSLARTGAAAAMYGDDVRADTAQYTSDNSLRGQVATAGASRAAADARLRYDMNKDNRDFKLRSDEAGMRRQETQLKQREASEKNVYDQVLNTLPPGPDGKPNTAGAAEYMRGLTARVADRQSKLEAHLTANPNDTQALAELSNIRDNGVGALGAQGKDKFITGMEAKSLRSANSGMAPWAGRDVATNQPITSLRRDPGLLWDDYVDNQGGRTPAYAVDKEGSFLGFGGRPNNKFDPLKEK